MAALARNQCKNPHSAGGKQQQKQQSNKKSKRERWVMLNKERFHEIFNETLLNEMTIPEQALPKVACVSPEAARTSSKIARVSLEEAHVSLEVARMSTEVVKLSPEVSRLSPEVPSISSQVTHTLASEEGNVLPEAMPLNLVVSDTCDSDCHGKTTQLSTPSSFEQNNRQKNREKFEKKVNTESKSGSCPVDQDKATTDTVDCEDITIATTKSSDVFSELLKNRPLVSAALFGKQSSGSESSRSEIIPVAPGKAGQVQDEDTVIDPVGSPSTHPSTDRVIAPPSPARSHLCTPWEERTQPQSTCQPPPLSAACAGCETPAATSHSQRSDHAKNSSVSECTVEAQEKNVEFAECSKHGNIVTNMNSTMEVQRQNWVPLSKSTLYNLVDELVGSRLDSSGEEEEETKDRSPPSRRSVTSISRQSRTSCGYKDTAPHGSAGKVKNPLLKRLPAPSGSLALPSIPSANKQVLKQCWVALNKTVVFDMVEQAMAGEKTETVIDPPPPKLKPAYCDRDCSENQVDADCAINKQETNAKADTKKRAFENSDAKFSRKRKRISVGCPRRPASAPVESSSRQNYPLLQRAPSPYSKEYHVLQQEHASQCDKLLSEARHRLSVEVAATSAPHAPPADSRDSPKLGWVAVSKAEVHTIVDSVMSSLLQQEVNEGSDKAALARGSTPPPRHQAPHRPWLASSSSQVSWSGPCDDNASSPSEGSTASSASSSPSHDAHSKAPFKWKSSLLLRVHEQCNSCPPHKDTGVPSDHLSEEPVPLDMTSKQASDNSSDNKTSAPLISSSAQRRKSRVHKSK